MTVFRILMRVVRIAPATVAAQVFPGHVISMRTTVINFKGVLPADGSNALASYAESLADR